MEIHKRETKRKCRNKNLTGLGTGRKEGLSPGCLPPVLKDRLRVAGSFPEEERSRGRDWMLLSVKARVWIAAAEEQG